MTPPASLAGRLYLLGCRPESDRSPGGAEAAVRMRAAVLADLWLAGVISTDGGRPPGDPKGLVIATADADVRAAAAPDGTTGRLLAKPATTESTSAPPRTDASAVAPADHASASSHPLPAVAALLDPAAAGLLAEIAARGKPRSWAWWVGHGEKETARVVADQLAAAGTIEVVRSWRWGVFGRNGVRLCEPGAVEQVRAGVRATLLGAVPVPELDRRDVLLATLAVAGNIKPLWERAERRAARDRLKELQAVAGPVPAALRKVVRDRESAIAGATTAAVVAGASG